MFLYQLNNSFINQSIVSHQDNSLTVGDCLSDNQDNYYLVLGDTIHRPHLYKVGLAPSLLSSVAPQLLSSVTLNLIHHLVYEYYTTYTNIIKLYLPNDISKLLKKKSPLSSSKITAKKASSEKLTLIIMPDRRTIVNQQDQYHYTLDQAIWSQHTINQDIKLFRDIKHGENSNTGATANTWEKKTPWVEKTIVCTPGECFWDYWNLSQIILVDPHKWYYKSQQEPRYDIARVCELMAHYYWCILTTNT